jgi:1D-myo-inositol-tetrakisphosphate 5-kinase/inositol-polyphosphate multikinase
MLTDDSEGVLSDPSGEMVIKPCTQAEVDFYQAAVVSHPDFAEFIPTFMGTLHHNDSVAQATAKILPAGHVSKIAHTDVTNLKPLGLPTTHEPSSSIPGETATVGGLQLVGLKPMNLPITHAPSSSVPPPVAKSTILYGVGPLKGKKLDTDLHIVLENAASGFKRPNVLDLKLGARLWDDDTTLDKRARLDKVASETTSGSLGFRIAGMRVWQGNVESVEDGEEAGDDGVQKDNWIESETNTRVFNKIYGRRFTADNVIDGFKEYLEVPFAGLEPHHSQFITQLFLEEVKEIQKVLENTESRMYSASILMVYEGDPEAFKTAREYLTKTVDEKTNEGEDEDEDEDEDEQPPKLYAAKLIDFAHAHFTPGEGPDENVLQGVRSTVKILQELLEGYDTKIPSHDGC